MLMMRMCSTTRIMMDNEDVVEEELDEAGCSDSGNENEDDGEGEPDEARCSDSGDDNGEGPCEVDDGEGTFDVKKIWPVR